MRNGGLGDTDGVDTFTPIMAVSAPLTDVEGVAFTFGRVGGRWGLANGVTLEILDSIMTGGEPVARMNSGRVFALIATRSGRKTALLLSQVFGALGLRAAVNGR